MWAFVYRLQSWIKIHFSTLKRLCGKVFIRPIRILRITVSMAKITKITNFDLPLVQVFRHFFFLGLLVYDIHHPVIQNIS